MSNAQSIGLAAAVAIASMLGLVWLGDRHDPEVRQIVFRIDGQAGMVTVSFDSDGEITSAQRPIPCELGTTARNRVIFSINRADDAVGPIDVEMKVDGEVRGSTSSTRGALGRLEFSGSRVILSSITGL